MRQHVNPLSRFFQLPLELPHPEALFENPAMPIHLDIGCARGKFLLEMAAIQPEKNFLGLEIRQSLVIAAEREREHLGLKNLRFIFCNANVSLINWLSILPSRTLSIVSIQFPDPWFKRRHQKRRVLQPLLLISLAKRLYPGCQLFVQSDVLPVIKPMQLLIESSGCFDLFETTYGDLLTNKPFPVATEREAYAISRDLPIYRALYFRNNNEIPQLEALEANYQCFLNKAMMYS